MTYLRFTEKEHKIQILEILRLTIYNYVKFNFVHFKTLYVEKTQRKQIKMYGNYQLLIF